MTGKHSTILVWIYLYGGGYKYFVITFTTIKIDMDKMKY